MSDMNPTAPLMEKIEKANLPSDLKEQVTARLTQLSALMESPSFLPELDRMNRYIDWISKIPWEKKTTDVLDIQKAREAMNSQHYGLDLLKERILEYIAVMKLKGESEQNIARAPILCFVGLVGTGKTTFAVSLAEALDRKFARIPFGGMGDPLDLRGKSRLHAEAEPGKVIKALVATQSMNPVILLDEIDRVTDEGRSSIMGVLVELLDPQQNHAFTDHYIDYPVNLSDVIFVATANNTTHIATAVMDRLEPIQMPSYTDKEKVEIAKQYIFPKALEAAGMKSDAIKIGDDMWVNFVRPLGFDAGIRTLDRNIQAMVRKVAKKMVEEGMQNITISSDNIKEYLPQW